LQSKEKNKEKNNFFKQKQRYMLLRENIDPGATGCGELRVKLFDRLANEGVVFGGMFSGAMGGGIAMLVPCVKKEDLEAHLRRIAEEETIFAKLTPISFTVNTTGMQVTLLDSTIKE
jgi:hypothetical protein